MKKFPFIMSIVAVLSMSACGQSKTDGNQAADSTKAVVVYFSATGITKGAAELIGKAQNAPVFEIAPVQTYTDADLDWHNKQSRSSVEMADSTSRPAIKPIDADFAQYNTVFVGYPIWWDLAPREINTFIDSTDLKGKVIIPFATSGGSTIDNSVKALKAQYPDLDIREGQLLNGATEQSVTDWLKTLR